MFNADDIATLDYDFSGFYDGGPRGVVPEPSTEAISAYQLAIADLLENAEQQVKLVVGPAKPDEAKVEESDDEADSASDREKNAAISRINEETWAERKRLLAALCSEQPSFDEINRLGHRVFMKFEEYVLGKWTPQAASAATS